MAIDTPCPICLQRPRKFKGAPHCGDRACLRAHAIKLGSASPKPKLYTRDCNRCGRHYTGTGRLLCDECRTYVNGLCGTFDERPLGWRS